MHKSVRLLILLCIPLLLAACSSGGGQPDADAVATIVAATLQANQAPAPQEEANPAATTGSIAGTLSFPSEGIPAMNVVAYNTGSDDWAMTTTEQNQSTYQIDDLPAGSYYVVAYPVDSAEGGGYSQAVPCGLSVDCTDHSLIAVAVTAGQVTGDIDPQDWYAGPGAFPSNPAQVASGGSIAGDLSYPSEIIPPLNVVAFNTQDNTWQYVITNENQGSYQIDDLPAGTYYVVAYVIGGNFGGGYTAAVPCGLSADCGDHSLLVVTVAAGQVTSGIDPGDWYAPDGAFPPNPVP